MSEFLRINQPRIDKILKMLDTIETSARSNKATDQLAALLEPKGEGRERRPSVAISGELRRGCNLRALPRRQIAYGPQKTLVSQFVPNCCLP